MNSRTLTHADCRADPKLRRRCGCGVQAKDIADADVLTVIVGLAASPGRWTMMNDLEWRFGTAGFPRKVILAKMRSMIRRGLVDGCDCGCRGDFTRAGE